MSLLSLFAQTSTDLGVYSAYDPYSTPTTSGVATGISMNTIIFFLLLDLAVYIFMALCLMKIFKKAGRKNSWAAWIPFYNFYVYYEVAGRPGWWILLVFVPFIGPFVTLVTYIIASLDLAKSFGKSAGFGWLLALIPIVGQPMLAFGDAAYQGAAGPNAKTVPTMTPPAPPVASPPTSTPPTVAV